MRLTSYVLLKPGPTMTEDEGICEAIMTIEYLFEICQKYGTKLVVYLNPTYAAKGTPLAKTFLEHKYKHVRIQSVVKVIEETRDLKIPIYTGLWSEGNAEENGDFTCHDDYLPEIHSALKKFNKTQDYSLLSPYTELTELTC